MNETSPSNSNPGNRQSRWMTWTGWLLACYWIALFVGTHTPRAVPLPEVRNADKVAHLVAYFGLAMLCALYAALRWGTRRGHALKIAGILAVYAALDELLQIPVGRTCDVMDWLADMTGTLVALSMFALMGRLMRSRATLSK